MMGMDIEVNADDLAKPLKGIPFQIRVSFNLLFFILNIYISFFLQNIRFKLNKL